MSIVKLTNISKVYGFGEAATMALDDVSLEINKGEFVAIMGHSGSGKSTLMNILGLLDRPTSGTYLLSGDDVDRYKDRRLARIRRKKIGFIFQSFNLLPRLNVIDNVSLPLVYGAFDKFKREKKAVEFLEKVDLLDRQYFMPSQLSGGQVQRVAVARALINKPSVILADEPTGNLDTESSANIMEILSDIHRAGNTIVMITHSPDLAAYSERIITMQDGKILTDKKNSKKPPKRKKKENKK